MLFGGRKGYYIVALTYYAPKDSTKMVTARKKAASKGSKKKRPAKKASKPKRRILTVNERPNPNLRTTQEAADLLGLKDAASVRKLYLNDKLEGRIVGRVLWIRLSSIERYKETRRPVGRPVGSVSGESSNKRGERETTYQREYKRRLRAGEIKPRPRKRGGRKTAAKKSAKRATKRA